MDLKRARAPQQAEEQQSLEQYGHRARAIRERRGEMFHLGLPLQNMTVSGFCQ